MAHWDILLFLYICNAAFVLANKREYISLTKKEDTVTPIPLARKTFQQSSSIMLVVVVRWGGVQLPNQFSLNSSIIKIQVAFLPLYIHDITVKILLMRWHSNNYIYVVK